MLMLIQLLLAGGFAGMAQGQQQGGFGGFSGGGFASMGLPSTPAPAPSPASGSLWELRR